MQSKLLAQRSPEQVTPTKETEPVVEQPKSIQVMDKEDEDEIAAVIAAAIAACGHQVVIKTITRITGRNSSAWAQSGRTEAMNLRQL